MSAPVSERVRDLAYRPLLRIDQPVDWATFRLPGAELVLHTLGLAQIAQLSPDATDVRASIASARAVMREHELYELVWWITPDVHDPAGVDVELQRYGVRPGVSAISGSEAEAMVLTQRPIGDSPADVDVGPPTSQAELFEAMVLMQHALGLPDKAVEFQRRRAWAELQDPAYPIRRLVARIADAVVGTARWATSPHGVNLFGGSVLESARGRGVYRAMVAQRWELAVERGTPALTVQAGSMSRPILERLGFRSQGSLRTYRDELLASEAPA